MSSRSFSGGGGGMSARSFSGGGRSVDRGSARAFRSDGGARAFRSDGGGRIMRGDGVARSLRGSDRHVGRHRHGRRHGRWHRGRYILYGAPLVYGAYAYGDGCEWMRQRALYSGNSAYWWDRYNACIYGYGY